GCYWNDHLRVLEGVDRAGARSYALNSSDQALHLHSVADANWALEQENQSGNEIIDDVLQSKTDADAQCAGDQSEFVELHSGIAQGQEKNKNEQQVVSDLGDCEWKPPLQGKS